MAVINYNRKFIYLFEPHTASRATQDALKAHVKGSSTVGHHHIAMEHLTAWRRQHVEPRRIKEFKVITTVRNPFDTLITRWKHGEHKNKLLEEFVDTCWDSELLQPARGLYKDAPYFCWYEHLQDDLRWMFSNSKLELGLNPLHKTEGKKPWQDYYTFKLYDMLCQRPDWITYMERFGYHITRDGRIELSVFIRKNLCQPI